MYTSLSTTFPGSLCYRKVRWLLLLFCFSENSNSIIFINLTCICEVFVRVLIKKFVIDMSENKYLVWIFQESLSLLGNSLWMTSLFWSYCELFCIKYNKMRQFQIGNLIWWSVTFIIGQYCVPDYNKNFHQKNFYLRHSKTVIK